MMAEAGRTCIGILGAGPRELELMLELQGSEKVQLVGIYDPDPLAPALALAEILGVPHGSDDEALERLATAGTVALPSDRHTLEEAVRWAGGLRAELVSIAEAHRRWGTTPPVPSTNGSDPDLRVSTERLLQDAVDVSARLQDRSELADWLLGLAMRAVGANGGSIQLLAPETAELYLVAARGLSERLVRLGRHRVGEGISGAVAATRSAQVVLGAKPGRLARERGEVHASISMPLEDAGGLVGVLNVSSTSPAKQFSEAHLHTLERLGPRIARLLRSTEQASPAAPRLDLPRLVRRFESDAADLPARLLMLCDHVRDLLGADVAALFLATEDGAWLRVVPTPPVPAPRLPTVRRSALDTALVERRWLHQPAAAAPGMADDLIASAVERALDPDAPARSHLYVPLAEMEPLGVLFLEFQSLRAAENALRDGDMVVEQLAFALEAQLREHRETERVERLAELARGLRRLLDLSPGEALDTALAAECARLVGGRRAIVRRVDEQRRTYSRPVTYGIPAETIDRWRALDARISEQTLHLRHAVLSTITDESDAETPAPQRCSLLSVPLFHAERVVGLVNVFEKQAHDCLDTNTFTRFDRELLEGFALVVARFLSESPVPAQHPAGLDPDGLEAVPLAEQAAARLDPAPARIPEPGHGAPRGESVQGASMDLRTALEEELARAAAERRGVGVWVLQFEGLEALGGASDAARTSLAAALRLGLRGADLVEWVSSEEMAILGLSSAPGDPSLVDRLAALLRPILARLGRELDRGVELRIGSSAYPQDGRDVRGLLAAAMARAR
jgi:GAF domain-containing protein